MNPFNQRETSLTLPDSELESMRFIVVSQAESSLEILLKQRFFAGLHVLHNRSVHTLLEFNSFLGHFLLLHG